jgi:hypothetical protein
MDKRLTDADFIRECAAIQQARNEAYKTQSDPLFFMVQAGEIPLSAWQSARQSIKDSLPYPDGWKDDPTTEQLDAQARAKRKQLLETIVDPVVSNPLRWNDLTADQQQAYKDYRQALLDITDQDGYPETIEWPTLGV